MTAPAGWEGILDTGETILWQGRPDGKIVLRPANTATFVFGLAFAGFALFWMIMASTAGGFFWAFGSFWAFGPFLICSRSCAPLSQRIAVSSQAPSQEKV